MKTAHEILEKHYKNYYKRIAYDEQVIDAMIEYAQAACKEQRQFCANVYHIKKANNEIISFEDIMNAPQPELK